MFGDEHVTSPAFFLFRKEWVSYLFCSENQMQTKAGSCNTPQIFLFRESV